MSKEKNMIRRFWERRGNGFKQTIICSAVAVIMYPTIVTLFDYGFSAPERNNPGYIMSPLEFNARWSSGTLSTFTGILGISSVVGAFLGTVRIMGEGLNERKVLKAKDE
jgi:hypothetical protein